jgi:hypothetical protein
MRRELLQNKDTSVRDFIANLTFIIEAVYSKNKRDPEMIGLRDKYSVARKESPEKIIEITGPKIWKYRKPISEGKVSFFLDNDFSEDIEEMQDSQSPQEPNSEKNRDLVELLDRARKVWEIFSPTEQTVIVKKVQGLLQYYSCYLSADKKLRELEGS